MDSSWSDRFRFDLRFADLSFSIDLFALAALTLVLFTGLSSLISFGKDATTSIAPSTGRFMVDFIVEVLNRGVLFELVEESNVLRGSDCLTALLTILSDIGPPTFSFITAFPLLMEDAVLTILVLVLLLLRLTSPVLIVSVVFFNRCFMFTAIVGTSRALRTWSVVLSAVQSTQRLSRFPPFNDTLPVLVLLLAAEMFGDARLAVLLPLMLLLLPRLLGVICFLPPMSADGAFKRCWRMLWLVSLLAASTAEAFAIIDESRSLSAHGTRITQRVRRVRDFVVAGGVFGCCCFCCVIEEG